MPASVVLVADVDMEEVDVTLVLVVALYGIELVEFDDDDDPARVNVLEVA